MNPTTEGMIEALEAAGVVVVDLRSKLPVHTTKTFKRRPPEKLRGVVFHHSGSNASGETTVEATARYHVGANHISPTGAPGLCYTAMVDGDGKLYLAWDIDVATWSHGFKSRAGDENAEFIGICFQGLFRSADFPNGLQPTSSQLRAASLIWSVLRSYFKWPAGALFGHFDFGKPSCPGDALAGFIHAQRSAGVTPDTTGRQLLMATLELDIGTSGEAGDGVDGVWGGKCRTALAGYQRDNGLPVTGDWSAITEASMRAKLVECTYNGNNERRKL